jgi:hypothetical protein
MGNHSQRLPRVAVQPPLEPRVARGHPRGLGVVRAPPLDSFGGGAQPLPGDPFPFPNNFFF